MAPPAPLMAMIVSPAPEMPSLAEIARATEAVFGDLGAVRVDSDQQEVHLSVESNELVVLARSESLPQSLLEGPASDAWYWPEASTVMGEHRSHVAVVSKPTDADSVQRSLVLTRLTAALLQVADGSGVYWASATMVHSASEVRAAAQEMAPRRLPLKLWINFRVIDEGGDDAGKNSLFTTGLDAFGEREIEIWGSESEPQELMGWAYNVAHYLLSQRPEIENGEAVGVDQKRFVHVFLKPSMFDADRQIYCLVLEK